MEMDGRIPIVEVLCLRSHLFQERSGPRACTVRAEAGFVCTRDGVLSYRRETLSSGTSTGRPVLLGCGVYEREGKGRSGSSRVPKILEHEEKFKIILSALSQLRLKFNGK